MAPNTLKAGCAFLCLALLASNLWSMLRWSEARGVYDDVCYLRQAHLFQRFGLGGFDTDASRDDDGYLKSKLKEIGYPTWSDVGTAPCHAPMKLTGRSVIQYPPGIGFVLALFPQGHQVVPMYMLATIAVFGFALLAIFLARKAASILVAAAFGCLAVYMMINPAKASYSMAPTMVVCALAGFLTAQWLAGPQNSARIGLIVPLGFLLGLSVDFRVANLLLASGYFLFLLVSLFASRKPLQVLQGTLFTMALIVGMAPTLVSNTINAGSPFASTYGDTNPDVRPLNLSFPAISDYLADGLQVMLFAVAIASTIYLLRRGEGFKRVALVTTANLVVPIAMLSLWSLLFAFLMQEMGVDTQDGTGGIAVGEVGSAVRMSLFGTFRTWRDVCRESVTCAEAEIPCRYKLLHLASAIHRSVAPIATAHRPSAGCPRCRAFPTSQIAKNALDRASSTSNRCSWSP